MGRAFYEDDKLVSTTPGLNVEMSPVLKEQKSAHGNISFLNGMGVRSAPYLEKYAEKLRLVLHERLSVASAEIDTQKSALVNEFANLKQIVTDIVQEPVVPQLINVVGPVLLTSVVVAHRSLPVRFVATTFVGGACVKYYMPRTYAEAKTQLLLTEKMHFQQSQRVRADVLAQLDAFQSDARAFGNRAENDLQRQIHQARKWLERVFED